MEVNFVSSDVLSEADIQQVFNGKAYHVVADASNEGDHPDASQAT
jgi:hypothetical protein